MEHKISIRLDSESMSILEAQKSKGVGYSFCIREALKEKYSEPFFPKGYQIPNTNFKPPEEEVLVYD